MDDLDLQSYGTPEEEAKAQKKQATIKEMQRRANDRVRVRNISNEDFIVRWDGLGFTVPASTKDIGFGPGQAILPRYVAQNFVTHFTNKYLGDKLVALVKAENERRRQAGLKQMDKFIGGEELIFSEPYKISNPELRREVLQQIWLGVEERYGDTDIQVPLNKPKDNRSIDEQLLDQLDKPAEALKQPQNRQVEPDVTITREEQNLDNLEDTNLQNKDVFTLHKIAKEKGIETTRTDKKADLIAKLSQ